MEIQGDFTCDICGESFDRNVEIAAHMSSHQTSIARETMITELQQLAKEKGRAPTGPEVDDNCSFTSGAVWFKFGGWEKGLRMAGLKPLSHTCSKAEIIEELQRVADDIDHSPSKSDFHEHGTISPGTVENSFGTWNDGLRGAGLNTTQDSKVPDSEVIRAIRTLADQLGHPPTAADMDECGSYSTAVAQRCFGDWNSALRQAGFEPHIQRNIPEEQLHEEIGRLTDELGHVPSSIEMTEHGRFSIGVYTTRYGSWQVAIEAAGHEYRGYPSGPESPVWKGGYEDISYGPNWHEQRTQTLQRDDFQCQMPGCTIDRDRHQELFDCDLNVHHIIPIRSFVDADGVFDYEQANRIENLATVCHRHHPYWNQLSPLQPDIR